MNLIPFLTDRTPGRPHDQLFWRAGKRTAIRVGDWKLVRNPGYGKRKTDWELYDLAEDIGETNDLAVAQPDRLKQLKSVWQQMNAEMIEPFWSARR